MQGRHEEALGFYDAALAADPDLAMAHAGKGDALFRLERYAEAIPVLERAVALRPGALVERSLLLLTGRASEALGRTGDAARYLERAARTGGN